MTTQDFITELFCRVDDAISLVRLKSPLILRFSDHANFTQRFFFHHKESCVPTTQPQIPTTKLRWQFGFCKLKRRRTLAA